MSFHAFHGHSGSGMTRNEIETEWQGWGRNDDFSHSEHIPIIPVIPDVWEKCCLSWFHPYHSSLIPSFWCHSKIPFQLEWCWNDEWFWAEVDYFPLGWYTGATDHKRTKQRLANIYFTNGQKTENYFKEGTLAGAFTLLSTAAEMAKSFTFLHFCIFCFSPNNLIAKFLVDTFLSKFMLTWWSRARKDVFSSRAWQITAEGYLPSIMKLQNYIIA